jgi:hypothetical protein
MKRSSGIIFLLFLIFACVSQPSLQNYQAESTDEKKVIEVVSEFQNAANTYDARRMYSLYSPEATIQTSTKLGSLKWEIFKREEWFKVIKQRFEESYVGSGLEFKFYPPKNIQVQENDAFLIIPYKLSSFQTDYLETGLFNFELKKKSSVWNIIKFRYEILTSNHSDWPEYQKWIEKRQ